MGTAKAIAGALISAIVLAAGLAASAAQAAQEPLWELGLGAVALSFPDYRGSNERQGWLLPFPYFVYRGEFLQADENRVRGVFFRSERLDFDVSLNGSPPVDSNENAARRGMPDLDATLEIGPALNVLLARSADRKTRLELRLPARAVLASDFSHVQHVGWIFHPHLNLEIRDALGYAGWKSSFLAGPLFGDRRYNRYFYEVAPAYATPLRPAYTPGGGYAGTQVLAALSKRYRDFWVGGFVRWDTVSGAAFEDSPLVKQRQGVAAGISIAWILGVSKTSVETTR